MVTVYSILSKMQVVHQDRFPRESEDPEEPEIYFKNPSTTLFLGLLKTREKT